MGGEQTQIGRDGHAWLHGSSDVFGMFREELFVLSLGDWYSKTNWSRSISFGKLFNLFPRDPVVPPQKVFGPSKTYIKSVSVLT